MTQTMTPIDMQRRRPPEAGRIRIGIKSGRAMKAIDTFRFTSPHRKALDQLAALHGGEVRPWEDPMANKGQFEVITEAKSIEVMVVPNGLSTGYELWNGGGCARRCDGYTVEVAVKGMDEPQESPCICNAKGIRECDPKTRLNVVIPNIDFFGVWRLESKGWNAAEELPGMYDMISNFAEQGSLVRAHLNLEQRTKKANGKTKHFAVPTLSLAASPDQLLSSPGNKSKLLLNAPQVDPDTPQLEATLERKEDGEKQRGTYEDPDDDVVEAVIVDPEREMAQEAQVRDIATQFGLDPDSVVAILWTMTDDPDKIDSFIGRASEGKVLRITQNNTLAWRSPE